VSQRRHAASDGSFAKSAGGAAGRGLLLIAVAVITGVLLLNAGFDDGGSANPTTDGGGSADTTASPDTTGVGPDGSNTTAVTTPVSVRPPNQVKVFVANAAGIQGAAGRTADALIAAGYVAVPGNSPTRVEATAIYYTEGFEAEAQAVAATLGVPATSVQPMPTPPPVAEIEGAQVLVVLGPDIATPA
jgi:hypothetical protein